MSKPSIQIIFLIVIASVLAAAIFGFSVMSEPGHAMAGCFGSAPGGTCSMLSPIEHFTAHISAFQRISTAVVRTYSPVVALLILALAVLFLVIRQIVFPEKGFVLRQRGDFIPPQRLQLVHWLSLHEKRDPSFVYAMNN